MAEASLCLLHIGKTGGSFLKDVLEVNRAKLPQNLKLLPHGFTLKKTRKRFGVDRRVAFVFREPTGRFVSAFNSRMRQGRPTYQTKWNAQEAAAFLWFETANDLAEGLCSTNERVKSAAIFAMESIKHVTRNYEYYLGGVSLLKAEDSLIHMCVELCDLDSHLPAVLARLGVNSPVIPIQAKRHAAPSGSEPLSPAGEAALRSYWEKEYRIYDYCRSIVRF